MSDRKPKSNNEIFFLIILIINEKVVAQDDTNLLPNKQGIIDHNIVNNNLTVLTTEAAAFSCNILAAIHLFLPLKPSKLLEEIVQTVISIVAPVKHEFGLAMVTASQTHTYFF